MLRPCLRVSQPMPPPRVRPPTPVWLTSPTGYREAVLPAPPRSTSPSRAPPPARARRASGSTVTAFSRLRSIIRPSSTVDLPETLCAPPRTAISRPLLAANVHRRGHVGGGLALRDRPRAARRWRRSTAGVLRRSPRHRGRSLVRSSRCAESWCRSSRSPPRPSDPASVLRLPRPVKPNGDIAPTMGTYPIERLNDS